MEKGICHQIATGHITAVANSRLQLFQIVQRPLATYAPYDGHMT